MAVAAALTGGRYAISHGFTRVSRDCDAGIFNGSHARPRRRFVSSGAAHNDFNGHAWSFDGHARSVDDHAWSVDHHPWSFDHHAWSFGEDAWSFDDHARSF